MSNDAAEERALRAVALENARSILAERQRIERELTEQRERLRVTLASIGDAVISTDADGRVVFLNGVAEELTGWSSAEAKGLPLTEVFHIINATTRRLVENPALQALVEGRVVALANHTLLIARDGTERAIEDSAAPIRGESADTLGAVLVFRDVTERKRADMARSQLATIVESSQDAILSKTLDGTILSWNAGATRIFGYTAAEAIGQPITLLIPPDRRDEEPGILDRMRRGEHVDHFETVRVTKDGRRLDISLTISPIRDDEGDVVGVSKIARDITERTRNAAALRESEARHRFLGGLTTATQNATDSREVMATTARLLAEHLGVDRCAFAEVENEVIFVITGDYARGVPSIVGRWPIAAFGAECERAMGANEAYVVDDVDTDPRMGADLAAYRQTNIQAVICVPLRKAGKLTAAMAVHQTTARRWTAEEISLVQTVVAGSWETLERMRVARGLIETAQRLEIALAAASLGDWSWESTSDWVTFSPRAATIFGIAAGQQLTWTQVREIVHPDDRERVRIAVEQAVADRNQYDVEYRLVRGDQEVTWVSAKGSAHYGPAREPLGMLGVVQDITERKHLEQELRQRAVELAEADRKKDEFIALLAHELRNPLAPIRAGLQVMRLAPDDKSAVARARLTMDRQLGHMVRLIDDLLDVSRLGRSKLHLQKGRVLLAEAVHHALEAAGPALEAAGHRVELTLPVKPITLDADLTRLAQVFGNLINNSAKYTHPGGKISLTAEVRDHEAVVSVTD
ncbi:MAG: PAS domain S-box protein, partial [Candidatus Limnocylindria bacterium]